jgi:hypothetical protein
VSPRWSSNARAAPVNLSSRKKLMRGSPWRQDRQASKAKISNSPCRAGSQMKRLVKEKPTGRDADPL